jgi:acyl-CoA thioesterase-1
MSQRDLPRKPAQHDSSRRNLLLHGTATLGALLFSKLGLASASTATPTPARSVHAATEGTLLVFGDSLSAGYGLRPGEEWPALLQHRLSTQGSRIRISNASISGETTGGGLARFPAALAKAKPKWVILELGANDGLRGYPVKTMHDNLVAMIKLSQQAGARVMIIGMYIPPNYGKPYTEAFAKQFRDIADEYKLVFVPFLLEPVILKDGMLMPDRLHPTAAGQPLLLDWLWPKITTLIESD